MQMCIKSNAIYDKTNTTNYKIDKHIGLKYDKFKLRNYNSSHLKC